MDLRNLSYLINHTSQQQPLFTHSQGLRLITGRAQHQLHPFFFGKRFAPLLHFGQINMRHLNGRQLINANRRSVLFFLDKPIAQLHHAPNIPAQKAVVLFRVSIGNRNILNTQDGKLRKICIFAHIQMHGNHVDYRMAATRAQA